MCFRYTNIALLREEVSVNEGDTFVVYSTADLANYEVKTCAASAAAAVADAAVAAAVVAAAAAAVVAVAAPIVAPAVPAAAVVAIDVAQLASWLASHVVVWLFIWGELCQFILHCYRFFLMGLCVCCCCLCCCCLRFCRQSMCPSPPLCTKCRSCSR